MAFRALQPGQSPVSVESVKLTTDTGTDTVPPGGVVARVIVAQPARGQEVKP